MRDASLVADLKCSGCGRTLIKDGILKCTRCNTLVVAALGEKRIYCTNCSSPRVLLARDDEALCPERKNRCSNRKENKGTQMELAISEETEMVQESAAIEEVEGQQKSKTQELRDWLDEEIGKTESDIDLLKSVLRIDGNLPLGNRHVRYSGLTSDEREIKMSEDREKLEKLKKRLELLRSAKELDVDIDALEKAGFNVEIYYHTIAFVGNRIGMAVDMKASLFRDQTNERVEISMSIAYRELSLEINGLITYKPEGITSFEIDSLVHYTQLVWRWPSVEDKGEYVLILSVPESHEIKINAGMDVRDKK